MIGTCNTCLHSACTVYSHSYLIILLIVGINVSTQLVKIKKIVNIAKYCDDQTICYKQTGQCTCVYTETLYSDCKLCRHRQPGIYPRQSCCFCFYWCVITSHMITTITIMCAQSGAISFCGIYQYYTLLYTEVRCCITGRLLVEVSMYSRNVDKKYNLYHAYNDIQKLILTM